MTEASVLGPMHKRLRDELPGSVVVKHHDASLIGLVDTSITWRNRTLWLEAKLYELPKKKIMNGKDWRDKAIKESPAQAEMVRKLNIASMCVYLIWIKKTCLYIGLYDGPMYRLKDAAHAAKVIKWIFELWCDCHNRTSDNILACAAINPI